MRPVPRRINLNRTIIAILALMHMGSSTLAHAISCRDQLAMPTPIEVIVDFERGKIVFAVEATSRLVWPRITAPRTPGSKSAAYTTFDRSLIDAETRVAAVPADAHWIDVTEAYREIAESLFTRLGPEYRNQVDERDEVTCLLDDRNCHQVTSLAVLSRVYDYLSEEILRDEGLIEIPEGDRKFARVSLVLDVWGQMVTTYHSMIHLPGTDWVIHKEGYGSTLMGAVRIDDATAPYRGNLYSTETRYFAPAEAIQRISDR